MIKETVFCSNIYYVNIQNKYLLKSKDLFDELWQNGRKSQFNLCKHKQQP